MGLSKILSVIKNWQFVAGKHIHRTGFFNNRNLPSLHYHIRQCVLQRVSNSLSFVRTKQKYRRNLGPKIPVFFWFWFRFRNFAILLQPLLEPYTFYAMNLAQLGWWNWPLGFAKIRVPFNFNIYLWLYKTQC